MWSFIVLVKMWVVLGMKLHIVCIRHVSGQAAAAACGLTCGHGTEPHKRCRLLSIIKAEQPVQEFTQETLNTSPIHVSVCSYLSKTQLKDA